MATQTPPPPIDGATLSPKLKAKGDLVTLPIGKQIAADGVAVARVYKHAAGKSSTYAPQVVDMIYHMSRQGVFEDRQTSEFVAAKLAAERESPRDTPPATWDQLVFLSANLTRLVIDPYREKCNAQVTIGPQRAKPLALGWPIVLGHVDFGRLPKMLLGSVVAAAGKAKIAVEVSPDWPSDFGDTAQRIVMVDAGKPLPDLSGAAAVEISAPLASQLDGRSLLPIVDAIRQATGSEIPIGIVAPAVCAAKVVNETIDLDVDFYVCDAQWIEDARPQGVFPELDGPPKLAALTDMVERLRHHCREGLVQVIYRGGIRGGADAGKAICLGATAVTLGLSAVVGMGFRLTSLGSEDALIEQLSKPRSEEEITDSVYNFAKSVIMEVTMLARASGKSNVYNMEPEDLRALTIEMSAATGIPLAGRDYCFRACFGPDESIAQE